MSKEGDQSPSDAGQISSKLTSAVEVYAEYKLFNEVENQAMFELVYERFDEQLKLLHEQKIAQ